MYRTIGFFVVLVIFLSAVLLAFSLYVARGRIKQKYPALAGIAADTLDFFYKPMTGILQFFSRSPEKLHEIMVQTKNASHRPRFIRTENRIIIAPHCMRHRDCPAHATRDGIQCVRCGKCIYTPLKKIAEAENYKVYIITGSSFVKHILKSEAAKGVDGILAIGCWYELNKGMRELSRYKHLTTYGYAMLNAGCWNTSVDLVGFEKLLHDLRPPVSAPDGTAHQIESGQEIS